MKRAIPSGPQGAEGIAFLGILWSRLFPLPNVGEGFVRFGRIYVLLDAGGIKSRPYTVVGLHA